jgi:hypothetical protein
MRKRKMILWVKENERRRRENGWKKGDVTVGERAVGNVHGQKRSLLG